LLSTPALVRIAAAALGDGLPRRDLTLTGDHAMMIDGVLFNASALVNGQSIRFLTRAEMAPKTRVYNVETQAHEVLLAEGAASESFIDHAGRSAFGNYDDYLRIHGAERMIPEMDSVRITTRRLVPETIRARLGSPEEDILDVHALLCA
jgi:hypothetical protein